MSSHATRDEIRSELEVRGIPFRMACPECGGGGSKEQCLTVFEVEDGSVLATCHRAQCSMHTISVTAGLSASRFKKVPTKEDNTWRTVYDRSVPVETSLIRERYAFWYTIEALVHIRYDPVRDRLVFPLTNHERVLHSIVTKRLHEYQNPKSLFLGGPDAGTGMGWYVHGYNTHTIVVVEDCLSALAVFSLGGDAVSLNGTHINAERLHELSKGAKHVVLCLDADATRNSIAMVRKYMSQMSFTMRRLTTDFKDMTRADVDAFMERL